MKPQVPLPPELLDVFKPSGLLAPISSNANIKCHPISSNAILFNYLSTYGVSYYDISVCVIIVYALSSYARKSGEPLLFIWISLWSTVICLVNKYVLYQNVLCTYGTKKIFLDETKWEIWRGVNCIHTSPGHGAWKNPTGATVEYEILCTRLRLDAQYFVLHCCPRWVFSYTTPRRGVYTLWHLHEYIFLMIDIYVLLSSVPLGEWIINQNIMRCG